MAIHNILGKRGEDIAIEWLRRNGYEILDRNWRCGRYELDVVCLKGEFVVVVEVKSRRNFVADPAILLPVKKRKAILRAAACWLGSHKFDAEIRFDLIVVDVVTDNVSHHPDAIMVYDM